MRLPIRPSIFIALLLVAIFSGHIWGSSRQPDVPNATAYDNTQEMLKKVGEDVVSQVDDYEATTKIWAAENSEKGTPVSVKGYDFRIASSNAPTLSVRTTIYFEDLWDGVQTPKQGGGYIYKLILQKLFKDYGFKESENSIQQKANAPATYTGEGMPDPITVTNGDVSCTISATQYTAETVCDSMQIQKYLAQRMKPFADAYAKGSQTWIKDIVAGPLVIKSEKVEGNYPIMASRTSGYDVAEMVTQMGDKRRIALFYANYNKSSEWHYITEATDEFGFPCKDIMKSRDARKAMYDQICYQDGVGQIRVDNDRLTLQ